MLYALHRILKYLLEKPSEKASSGHQYILLSASASFWLVVLKLNALYSFLVNSNLPSSLVVHLDCRLLVV